MINCIIIYIFKNTYILVYFGEKIPQVLEIKDRKAEASEVPPPLTEELPL